MSSHPTDAEGRRRTDRGAASPIAGHLRAYAVRSGYPVLGGQALLVASGLITTTTMPMFTPDRHVWSIVGLLSAVMLWVLACTVVAPWSRLPRWCTLLFPAAVAAALAALGLLGGGAGTVYTGLLVLCFAHIGLTQPPRTTLWALPFAVGAWVAANDGWSLKQAPRMLIAVLIWVCLGELLAELMRRQRALSAQLVRAANTDVLTGVANRRSLNLHLATLVSGDTLVLCDLDHFKRVNDSRGHPGGDRVLADFGLALQACLRDTDFPARFGGEEFAILLPATAHDRVGVVLERLHHHWSVLQPGLTFSAGVATCHDGRDGVATLAAADRSLYEAKTGGRDQDRYDRQQPAPTHQPWI